MAQEGDRFPLHTAARLGQVSVAEGLLKTDSKLSKKKDDDERYPIHWACSSNSHDIVVMLANQSSFDPDLQDGSGWTPLMISASVPESDSVVKLLLSKGADVNEKTAQYCSRLLRHDPKTDTDHQTALHFVSSKKNLDTARLLIEHKASTRVRDKRGQYPIHRAAAVGSTPMVNLLLRNLSPLNPTDVEGFTPLHHAIAEGHGDVAVALLKEGADYTLKTNEDMVALDLAPDKDIRRYIMQGAEREGVELELS